MKERKMRISERMRSQYQTEQKKGTPRNVRFSDGVMESTPTKKRHHSTSILKNKKTFHNFNNKKGRSDSVNSLAGQGPKDDQSCENSILNKMFKDEYVKILQKYSTKGNYVDQIFPPVISSLFSYAGRKKFKEPTIKWKRIPDIFPDRDLIMWGVDPIKNFIRSSSNFANEYFGIGLNCMKGNKTLLRKMFESQKPNPQGVYYVKIFQGNVWKYTIIDDHIPVFEEKKGEKITYRPVFIQGDIDLVNKSDPIQIWPYLVQKAFAKYYSSYESLQTGNVFDFLEELTNNSIEYVNMQNFKIDLRQFFKQQVDLIAFGEDENQVYHPIFIGTALSQKIWFENPKNPKIRNNILPQELPNHFKNLYLVKSNIYTYLGYCPIRQTKQSISVRYFHLQNPTKCSITLSQKDHKFFQQSFKYSYKWIRIIILLKQINDNGFRWIDGRYDNQKSMTIQSDFQAGEYYIVVLPEWQQRAYDLNLILRTKTPLRLQRKVYEEGLIEQGCADLAQRYGRLNQLNTYICSYNCIHEDLGMIIENINNERTKGQVRVLRSIDGLKAKLPLEPINKQFKKNKSIEVIIKNNSHFTVVLMMKGGIDRNFFQNFDFGSK